MADDSILPLLFLGGAGYLLWQYYQQTPATSPATASGAGSSSTLYHPLLEQTPPVSIPPPSQSFQSYGAAPGANSANSSSSSPFALFNFGSSSWGQPGANAPDPSIYRTTPQQAAQQSAAIDATMHAASVAEAPFNKITMDQHCTSLWGNPIPGCV